MGNNVMSTINLPADCDRNNAAQLLEQLRAANGSVAQLDGSAVAQIGQAMLQVLLAARCDQPSLTIVNPSSALAEAAQLAGVSHALLQEPAR